MDKIRIGMVGGGEISNTHRVGLEMDQRYHLLAGVFSRDKEKSHKLAQSWGIARVYSDYCSMKQSTLMEYRSLRLRCPRSAITRLPSVFLTHGIHVICDKPITQNLKQGRELLQMAEHSSGAVMQASQKQSPV